MERRAYVSDCMLRTVSSLHRKLLVRDRLFLMRVRVRARTKVEIKR